MKHLLFSLTHLLLLVFTPVFATLRWLFEQIKPDKPAYSKLAQALYHALTGFYTLVKARVAAFYTRVLRRDDLHWLNTQDALTQRYC